MRIIASHMTEGNIRFDIMDTGEVALIKKSELVWLFSKDAWARICRELVPAGPSLPPE